MTWRAEVTRVERVNGAVVVVLAFHRGEASGESFIRNVPLADIPEGNIARYVRGQLIRLAMEDEALSQIEVGPVG